VKYSVSTSSADRPGNMGSGSVAMAARTPGQHMVAPALEPSKPSHRMHADADEEPLKAL